MRNLIVSLLLMMSCNAQAILIQSTVDNRVYDIRVEQTASFELLVSRHGFDLFPWWQNDALAEDLVGQVADQLGTPLGQPDQYHFFDIECMTIGCGPVFVVDGIFDPTRLVEGIEFYAWNANRGVFDFTDDSLTSYRFAVATVVPSPGALSLMLLGVALSGKRRGGRNRLKFGSKAHRVRGPS